MPDSNGILSEIIRRHDHTYQVGQRNPGGSSAAEIDAVAQELGVRLCEAHIEFLGWIGNDYRGIFVGTDLFTRDLVRNTQVLPEVFEEEGLTEFSTENLVCFYAHQGYNFAWYYGDGSSDPIVHQYLEVDSRKNARGFETRSDRTFSEFVAEHLDWRTARQ